MKEKSFGTNEEKGNIVLFFLSSVTDRVPVPENPIFTLSFLFLSPAGFMPEKDKIKTGRSDLFLSVL